MTMNDTENNMNGPSRSNTFMLYDDGSKDVSAPEDDQYEPFDHYEEDDGDGDDEKEEVEEAKVEEEADDATIDVEEVEEDAVEEQEEEEEADDATIDVEEV